MICFCGSAYIHEYPLRFALGRNVDTDYISDTPEPLALLGRAFLGITQSRWCIRRTSLPPASEWVLSVFHEEEGTALTKIRVITVINTYDCTVNRIPTCSKSRSVASDPCIRALKGMGTFLER